MSRKALVTVVACLAAFALQAGSPERSVVQIFTFSQAPDYDAPWRFDSVRRSGGSGFVIKGRRIMTNAHVIAWAKQVLVRRFQDPRPYQARVAFVGNDCDLALLEVEDPAFFDGIEPLEFGELPAVRSTVVTYGYPAGGEQISYTRGVVSRIEVQNYVHSGHRSLLAVQTDAAINPGNSGGPVLQDDKVVGVSFQGIPGLENAGFFIPTEVIQHFLKDVDDGKYDGFPLAGIRLVPLQNPAYRKYLGLSDMSAGARVDSLLSGSTAEKVLKPDDVLLEVGGLKVGSDGTVLYRDNRVAVSSAFQMPQSGETIKLKILRDRQPMELELPVAVFEGDKLAGNQYEAPPRYYVNGGLVFTSLSADYLRTLGRDRNDDATSTLVYELYYRRSEDPDKVRPEPVVLAATLAHPVNADLDVRSRMMVNKINGIRIERLEDVIRAFEENQGKQHVIEFAGRGAIESLDREAAAAATAEILKTYGITSDRRL
ncbi:MAG TPA: trypsin-like peptidase domain-containing protein [Verrucomicrobiota bacterium]|nr:peptidase S1 [Verrucomicrobiales bacterium]HRI12191.1 trypsin-like peptidase domain-containing protein [Verrucomicrobiota bacterium]